MIKENAAWFEARKIKVEGFDSPGCPHGFLRYESDHSLTDASYKCTECGESFVVKMVSE